MYSHSQGTPRMTPAPLTTKKSQIYGHAFEECGSADTASTQLQLDLWAFQMEGDIICHVQSPQDSVVLSCCP